MKIRNGFVSNSSSSSFIIVCKNVELSSNILMNAFDIEKDSQIYNIIKTVMKILIDNIDITSVDDYMKEFYYNTEKDFEERNPKDFNFLKKIRDNKWEFNKGEIDKYKMYDFDIDYEDDNIIFKKFDD